MNLPFELWEIIGLHLDSISYHQLRQSSSLIKLPKYHVCSFQVYSTEIKKLVQLKTQDYSLLKLNVSMVNDHMLLFLAEFGQFRQFENAFKLGNFSDETITKSFSLLVSQLNTLQVSVLLGHVEREVDLVQQLIEKIFFTGRVNPIQGNNQPLRHFARHGNFHAVKQLLLVKEVDPTAIDCQAILSAAHGNFKEIVDILLVDDRLINHFQYLFEKACLEGYMQIAEFLITKTDTTRNHQAAFQVAIARGYSTIVELFIIDGRCDPSFDSNSYLQQACGYGYVKVVELLLRDQRVSSSVGSALTIATMTNQVDVVELLLPFAKDIEVDASLDTSLQLGFSDLSNVIHRVKY